mmetsp:Transcript_11878/g.30462  ORF Transcript_11878/g.30462 Transcript_11878/m.30462 type:complete len:85 (-) Transcript_11878:30-284(-)
MPYQVPWVLQCGSEWRQLCMCASALLYSVAPYVGASCYVHHIGQVGAFMQHNSWYTHAAHVGASRTTSVQCALHAVRRAPLNSD